MFQTSLFSWRWKSGTLKILLKDPFVNFSNIKNY